MVGVGGTVDEGVSEGVLVTVLVTVGIDVFVGVADGRVVDVGVAEDSLT